MRFIPLLILLSPIGLAQQQGIQADWRGTKLAGVELRNVRITPSDVSYDVYNGGKVNLVVWTVYFAHTDDGESASRFTVADRCANDIPLPFGVSGTMPPQAIAPGKGEHFMHDVAGIKWVALRAVVFADNAGYGEEFALTTIKKERKQALQDVRTNLQAANAVLNGQSAKSLTAAQGPFTANAHVRAFVETLQSLEGHSLALGVIRDDAKAHADRAATCTDVDVRGGLQ
jgi:hypothetical protein